MLLIPLLLLGIQLNTVDVTAQQRSMLQSAVNIRYLNDRLIESYQRCQSALSGPELSRLHQELLHYSTDELINQTLQLKSETFNQLVQSLQLKPNRGAAHWLEVQLNCDETALWQQMFSDYRSSFFELELSTPLDQSFADNLQKQDQSNLEHDRQIQELIEQSSSIAIVTVVDKNNLSAIEQANYLHIEYHSDLIFRAQHGWKNYPPLFLGMHSYLSANELSANNQKWLIFLNHHQHFILAIPSVEAKRHLQLLGKADWSFDRHGNLNRNPE